MSDMFSSFCARCNGHTVKHIKARTVVNKKKIIVKMKNIMNSLVNRDRRTRVLSSCYLWLVIGKYRTISLNPWTHVFSTTEIQAKGCPIFSLFCHLFFSTWYSSLKITLIQCTVFSLSRRCHISGYLHTYTSYLSHYITKKTISFSITIYLLTN